MTVHTPSPPSLPASVAGSFCVNRTCGGKVVPQHIRVPRYQSPASKSQMGISSQASEACLLTKQGRQRGHQRPWFHTNFQMVTEGPISCYTITKKVPCSLPPPPPPPPLVHRLVPPPSLPPLRKRRENRRCRDCIIASITVIIYTSILSYSLFFACYCNQSQRAWSVQLRHAKRCRYLF